MQWDDSSHAGFSTAEPWISVHDDYKTLNAAKQIGSKESVYQYWASVLRLRKEFPDLLVYGRFELMSGDDADVFSYTRTSSSSPGRAVVVANFRPRAVKWTIPQGLIESSPSGKIALSNYPTRVHHSFSDKAMSLEPLEAFIWISGE